MPEDPPEEGTQSQNRSTAIPQSDRTPREILELDHVYEALGHKRRRYLCYTLLESTEWSLTDLATKIAAYENDCFESDVPASQREQVFVSLYHVHVPKLVAEDVIRFDETDEVIEPGPNARQVLLALEGMGATVDVEQEAHARSEIGDDES